MVQPIPRRVLRICLLASLVFPLAAGGPAAVPVEKFQQLDQLLPSPTPQRNAAGAPGHSYWQNRADYRIAAILDENAHRLTGRATITYTNASPDALSYLWLQVDPNHFARNADSRILDRPPSDLSRFPYTTLRELLGNETYASDLVVSNVHDAAGRPLAHTIVKTMMRIDLLTPLAPGARTTFSLAWTYKLNHRQEAAGRTA